MHGRCDHHAKAGIEQEVPPDHAVTFGDGTSAIFRDQEELLAEDEMERANCGIEQGDDN